MRLKRQGFDVFLPHHEENRRIARRMTMALTPLFPGYLFVGFDHTIDGWQTIKDTRGVQRLLCSHSTEKPLPLPQDFVESLQAEANGDGLLDMASGADATLSILPGQQARILAGPFTGWLSLCKESSARRVELLLELFGRPMTIEISPEHVEAVA
jgi:transcriptional antiterminator RfaH